MKAYCINCGSIQPSRFRPGQDAITNESYEDLCCDTCHFIVATIQDREASQQPSQARVVELVAAANKDAVLQASIDFIRELTGMEPPPIEVAPPETFQPFKTFADKVCAIFATPQAAAQPEPYGYHSPKTGKVYASTEAASMAMAGEVKTVYLATQAQPSQAVEPTEAQLVTGVKAMRLFVKAMRLFVKAMRLFVKAMRLFVTKNSIKDFRDGFIAAINAKEQPNDTATRSL